MTCIIGLEHEGSVYIGGDSAGVSELSLRVVAQSKVFINKDFIFGFAGSFRLGQILQYSLNPPKHVATKSDMAYLVNEFLDSVRLCFHSKGVLDKPENTGVQGSFLLGYRGKLYEVDSDFQVIKIAVNYASIGCGSDLALGAMHVLSDITDPVERITKSLNAAEYFSAGVIKPYQILNTQPYIQKTKPKPKRKKV